MQASRVSSRALKAFAAGSKQTRSLHMTGPSTFSSVLTAERPALNLPRDIAGLRAECQKRELPTSGTKDELTSRISAHELANKRPFSTAVQEDSKRPVPDTTTVGNSARRFIHSSTVDFIHLPDFDPDTGSAPVDIRVPIISHLIPSSSVHPAPVEEVEETALMPRIHSVSADSTHIHAPAAMAEITNNNTVDFQGMAATVASRLSRPVDETAGMAGQIWSGLMEDILVPKYPARA